MAKKKASKKKSSKNTSQDDLTTETQKMISIVSGKINDGFCDYSYKILAGVGAGFTHGNVTGKDVGLFRPSMQEAFNKLNVHFAVIDEAFKSRGIEIKNIDKMDNHEVTAKYEVIAFKIDGEDEAQRIILTATKDIGLFGQVKFSTPKIDMGEYGGYQFYNELQAAADEVRREVELYNNGNFDPVVAVDDEDPDQLTLEDQKNSDEETEYVNDESDEKAKKV